MAEAKTRITPPDRDQINIHEDYEISYWSKYLGCTKDQLKEAMKKVGVVPKRLETELKRR